MMNVNDLLQRHVEELEDLTKNHAKEKDELVQIQTTARTDLEFKITQVQRKLQIASLSLEKRSKELELAQLQGNLTGLMRNHDNALLMMEIGHKAAVQNLRSRQAIEPMVIKMLEEVAKMKRLQPIRKNFPVPYVHIVKKGLLFRKEVRRETRYEKRYEQIEPVVVQNQDSPTIWSLEGQIPNGCFVIYTVSFEGSRFIVSAKSDASRSTRSQHNSRSQKAIVQRSEMSGQSKYTTGITEDELMDALVSVISDVKDVCPCTHTIACPCPHACSYAHPSGVCDMPSLWDNSHITESSPVPPPFEVGKPSAYLQTIPADDAIILYHSLLGNLHYADPDVLEFFALVSEGTPFEELKSYFSEVALEEEIKQLHQLGFLVIGDEEQKIRRKIKQREISFDRGEMIRWLRLNTSTACNIACTYCHGTNDTEYVGSMQMPLDIAIKAIQAYTDILLEHNQKLMQIRYFGGEPLLNWVVVQDSLNFAVKTAAQHDMILKVILNTNAMLLTPSILKGLRIHRDYLHVIVSLDGTALAHDAARIYRKGKGSFEEVTQGLDLLQEACILTSISVTLGEHNKDHLKTLIDFLLERDIYSMGIDPVRIVSEESTPDSLADALIDAIDYARSRNFHISGLWEGVCERLENGAIGSFCGGSGAELSVLPSGEIFPCQSQPIRLGTLEDLKTRALFTTEAYHQVSMRVVGNLPDCRGCEIEGMCVGGCAADAYATEQNLYGRTKYCKFLQKMVRHHLAYLAELAYMDKSDSF